ncbi:xylulokinase [Rhodoferax koreense]|uniref:Xylulose kinase n=1 Tax=Rhodoferax koreensis TaxID=1842727 RepID=A0A1P8JT32_9BURK|nr:xylulokinase [Rhodoferax koreense]APW36924.1 xylulokinase [Rhodoferax koreense]
MYLGLDLGTSDLKALLLADDHRVVATAHAPLTVQQPRPLWSEQQPEAWWEALVSVMNQLASSHGEVLRTVRAVGLSGQMHGAVLLDAQSRVLRPAILWNDGRSGAACAALEQAVPDQAQITGNLAMPGFTAPKLWWLREHEPEVFQRTAKVLLPKDYLRVRMTGEAVSDCSDASGTLWLDVAARRWSPRLLEACGLDESQMPRLVEGSEVSAGLSPAFAARWGLRAGTPVAGGGGDNAASAIGMGVVAPGQGFVSLGTSGVVFLATDRFRPNPAQAVHAFCHALPQRWHQMAVMLSAASAVRWATHLLGFANEAAMLQAAATLSPADRAQAPLFLPYLSGERSPHNNPDAKGVLFGLTHGHDKAAVAYAVAEGVGFGLCDGWRTLSTAAPVPALSVVGGGGRSAWWVQLLADILAVPMEVLEGAATGAALGAARLAWLADGGQAAEVCLSPPVQRRFEPMPQTPEMVARYRRFEALYGALKVSFSAD